MSNLQTYYHFKIDFQKVDQHTGPGQVVTSGSVGANTRKIGSLLDFS